VNYGGPMPRYFFNLRNQVFVPDLVGKELAGDDAARLEAWRLARLCQRLAMVDRTQSLS
jgi:hypothetical protein